MDCVDWFLGSEGGSVGEVVDALGVRGGGLLLVAGPVVSQQSGVCGRTPAVRDALVAAAGVGACGDVTDQHLGAVTTLDLSVRDPKLTSLAEGDFDGLTGLQTIFLTGNELSSLPDLTALTALEFLWAHHNMLSVLPDLSANTALERLRVYNNMLSSLPDLSANTALTHLWAYGNRLSSLPDLSANTALEQLLLHDNRLSSLPDLSANTALQQVRVGYVEDRSIVSGDFLGDLPSDLLLLLVEGVPLSANDLATIQAITGLRYLYAGGTGLSSTEVDGLLDGLPAGLLALALDGNDLDGVTWSKLSRLSSLIYLDVTGGQPGRHGCFGYNCERGKRVGNVADGLQRVDGGAVSVTFGVFGDVVFGSQSPDGRGVGCGRVGRSHRQ